MPDARCLPLPGAARRAAFGKIVLNEAGLAWRRPVGLIAGVGIPVVLLVFFGELPKFHQASPSLGGLTGFDVYLLVLMVFGLAMLALLGLPIMPGVLQDISNYTPLGAAAKAIQDSMLGGFPPAAPLLVLAGYALVFGFLARRFFWWE